MLLLYQNVIVIITIMSECVQNSVTFRRQSRFWHSAYKVNQRDYVQNLDISNLFSRIDRFLGVILAAKISSHIFFWKIIYFFSIDTVNVTLKFWNYIMAVKLSLLIMPIKQLRVITVSKQLQLMLIISRIFNVDFKKFNIFPKNMIILLIQDILKNALKYGSGGSIVLKL